jgi:hypothetical protein
MKRLTVILSLFLSMYTAINIVSAEYTASDLRDPFKSFLPKTSVSRSSSVILREISRLDLSGIMWGEDLPLAIINGKVYKVGDSISGIKIVEISKQGVLLKYQEESFILKPK